MRAGWRVLGLGLWLTVALGWFSGSKAASARDVCLREPEDTSASKTPGDNGFRIKIAGRPVAEKYTPGQVYTVTINGTYPNQRLLGFMLVAVPENARDETTAMGTFQHFNHGLTKFAEQCPHVVTHTYQHPKAGVEVLWTAPPTGTGCVEFRATVIEYNDIWYKDDGALTKSFCEESGVSDDDHPTEMIPDCCACGTGKYQMTFHGLWSRQTHPKEYPTHKRLLHWSNIVGASHSKAYNIWQYGGYASKGIKEVCEFGYPRTLEQEMRQHSRDIRTVVKTPGIWWSEPHGLRQSRWARFSVDRRNHLLTMITMLGPSPDWCVGVSALNLCLPNCTWAGDMEIDLYPWDAGTDDGVTYMSRNMKSDPQQKIHRITNSFPNNPSSPFYNLEAIRPLARLTLRRIHPKPGDAPVCFGNETDLEISPFEGEQIETSEDDSFLTDMERKKLMMMKGGKCGTSEWGDWSECSTTCGVGQRFRKRMFLNPMVDEDMCGLSLMENENCIGIENECEKIGDDCAVTGWSDWSPCSVTCGKGVKERRRYYLSKMDMKRCTRTTEESDMCVAKMMDCEEALKAKNFTAICALSVEVGPCRGRFSRWYYDTTMGKCLQFTYGGCRGNNNRFRTAEECNNMCTAHMILDQHEDRRQTRKHDKKNSKSRRKNELTERHNRNRNHRHEEETPDLQGDRNIESVDCMVTPWSDYSECSATCGKSYKYKRRMVKREPLNGGKPCPKKLERKKRCNVTKCPRDCQLGPWSSWSACVKTCGLDSIQERVRPVIKRARRDGQRCETRIERRYCPLPPCPGDSPIQRKEKMMRGLIGQTDEHSQR